MNFKELEAERKRKLKAALYQRTYSVTQQEKTFGYHLNRWSKHPINSFKRWLILTFPKYFNIGE